MQTLYAQQYEQLWKKHWWWRAREHFVRGWLQRLARQNARNAPQRRSAAKTGPRRILDIGCGNGLFFAELLRYGEVWGVEPDAGLVNDDGPYRSRISVCGFDETWQPPTDRPLDWILMLDVLEHLTDDAGAVRHVRNLLAPGGFLLATVPALEMLWSAHDDANLHFRRYTKSTLRRLLENAGLEVQTVRYFFGWTIGPMLLRRMLSPGKSRAGQRGHAGGPSDKNTSAYRVTVPPAPVNAAMYGLSRCEQATLGRWGLPVGSSLLAIARRPDGK